MDHLDLLIIGGYHGEGRRRGIISHFLVAVAVPEATDDGSELNKPKEFHSVCRVGSGYSMSELAELLEKLTPHWQRVKLGVCPPGIEWTKEKPDVWIDPQKSYILEIKASEIYYSNMFRTGCTLRFPRVENIRYDKSWYDCTTTLQLEQLRQEASGKLSSRHAVVSESMNGSPPKKPRQMVRVPATVAEQFRGADFSDVVSTSRLLDGREFCVLAGSKDLTKQEIEMKIVKNGGTIVQNLRPATFCAVAGDETALRVRTAVSSGEYDVATLGWLLRLLSLEGCRELPAWMPCDLISRSLRTDRRLAREYDKYGDSYTMPATSETLMYSLNQVKNIKKHNNINLEDMADMDIELFSGPSPYGIFRLCFAYFEEDVNTELDIASIDFSFYGGQIIKDISQKTTHIILYSKYITQDKLAKLDELNHQRQSKFHIVTELWIQSSIDNKKRVQEQMHS